jgi:type IV pilus assembly protein PilE
MNRNPMNLKRNRMAGITLLELMIVVTVIGVLGMIALPSYRQYVMRSQRTEAKAALLQLATNQERFYLANRTYTANPALLGFPSNITERGTYALAIPVANANTFEATATPRTGGAFDMTGDGQCTQFRLTSQGAKTATGSDTTNCW